MMMMGLRMLTLVVEESMRDEIPRELYDLEETIFVLN